MLSQYLMNELLNDEEGRKRCVYRMWRLIREWWGERYQRWFRVSTSDDGEKNRGAEEINSEFELPKNIQNCSVWPFARCLKTQCSMEYVRGNTWLSRAGSPKAMTLGHAVLALLHFAFDFWLRCILVSGWQLLLKTVAWTPHVCPKSISQCPLCKILFLENGGSQT